MILAAKMRITKNTKTLYEGNNQGKARPGTYRESENFPEFAESILQQSTLPLTPQYLEIDAYAVGLRTYYDVTTLFNIPSLFLNSPLDDIFILFGFID